MIIIYSSKNILKPFSQLTQSIQNLKDISKDHKTPCLGRADELGNMAQVVEKFKFLHHRSSTLAVHGLRIQLKFAERPWLT